MKTRVYLVLVGSVLLRSPVAVADSWELPPAVLACLSLTDNAQRLECFDREIAARVAQRPELPPAGPQTPEERFGYSDVRAREERALERDGDWQLTELVATVAAVSVRPDGKRVMTLGNGQVWAETNLDHRFRVSTGEQIRIRNAALGTFLMSTPSNRSTRVTRLK
jgi:hypothetical protein